MATAESVKSKIQGLISQANEATGKTDADLTTAIGSLIAGFGQGGGDDESTLTKLIEGIDPVELVNNQITTVRASAFRDCPNLVSVDFPAATSIGTYAFHNCASLTTANLPAATSIDNYVFTSCRALTTINSPAITSVGKQSFASCSSLTTANFPVATSIDGAAFTSCKALTTVNLPAVISVGIQSFDSCSALTNVDFPVATSINNYAFNGCKALTIVVFPAVTSISNYAFYNCTLLATADFPAIMSISDNAFIGCRALTTLILRNTAKVATLSNTNVFLNTPIASGAGYIYVPRALVDGYKAATNWSTYANQFRALEDYTVDGTTTGKIDLNRHMVRFFDEDGTFLCYVMVPNGGTAVYPGKEPAKEGDWEFTGWNPAPTNVTTDMDCYAQFKGTAFIFRKLASRTLSGAYTNDRVGSIGNYAFYGCSSLTTVNFPVATSIGSNAFDSCSLLTTANFPAVTSIGGSAFHNCSALTTANFPVATSIGTNVFQACSALTTADFPAVTSIGGNTFQSCSKLTTLILRNTAKVATLSNTSAFTNTPIASGTGYIYVPSTLVDSYKAATNWSTYANQFRALEDYTVDGTITGELDPNKI